MKSLCNLPLLLLLFMFIGCIKSDDDYNKNKSTKSKWIAVKGGFLELYSKNPIAGAKMVMSSSHGLTKDTVTGLNGGYSFDFYAEETETQYELDIFCDSVLTNHQTGTQIKMYPPIFIDKLTLADISSERWYLIPSFAILNVGLKNVDGVDEKVDGNIIIRGDTIPFGPILSSDLTKEFFPPYGDTISLKAIIHRANKPTVLVEKIFFTGPLREQKIELEYK